MKIQIKIVTDEGEMEFIHASDTDTAIEKLGAFERRINKSDNFIKE